MDFSADIYDPGLDSDVSDTESLGGFDGRASTDSGALVGVPSTFRSAAAADADQAPFGHSDGSGVPPDRAPCLRACLLGFYRSRGASAEEAEILLESVGVETLRRYASAWEAPNCVRGGGVRAGMRAHMVRRIKPCDLTPKMRHQV